MLIYEHKGGRRYATRSPWVVLTSFRRGEMLITSVIGRELAGRELSVGRLENERGGPNGRYSATSRPVPPYAFASRRWRSTKV